MADDYFRLAHNDVTGRPRLSQRVASIGLAAGLLGELVNTRHIEVYVNRGRYLVLADVGHARRHHDRDTLEHRVLREIEAEPRPLEVRLWLAYLARDAYARVASRLEHGGHVQVRRRQAPFRTVTYLPSDMNKAGAPLAVLSQQLRRGSSLGERYLCLSGLAIATGLDQTILAGAPPDVAARARAELDRLWEPTRTLIRCTETAVGEAVLSARN